MRNCPVCQTETSTMVCTCGFDGSRDYEAYPTFGRLPAGLPSIAGLTEPEEEPRPRKAIVKCPECGLEATIYENDYLPTCSKCEGIPLNPADQLWAQRLSFNSALREKGPGADLRLFYFADQIYSHTFRYANRETAQSLSETFSTLGRDPASLGIQLPEHTRQFFSALSHQTAHMIREGEIEKNVFDEWEAATAEVRRKQADLAKGMGFTVRGEKIRFPAFRAEDYRRHTQSPLFLDAAAAYANEDYKTAARLYQAAEAEGNPYAAAHLGMIYHSGKGYDKDHQAALDCFERGARAGCPLAAAWLCDCIRLGQGTMKSEDTAEEIYAAVYPALRQMCDAGDNDARYFLGFNLLKGICIQKDEAAGIRLLEQAHAQGHKSAAVQLAACYYYGEGVQRSYDTAFRLLRENQTAYNKKAQFLLGRCYYHGLGTEMDYDRAFRHFKRAAELDHGAAKDYLGDCYNYGRGTEIDYAEAAKWYHDAADNHKDTDAAHSLAFLYYNGQGVEKNEKTAFDYWMIAAEGGVTQAQRIVSEEYLRGGQLEKDNEKARVWMEKAAEQGDAEAQVMLGRYYISDFGFDDESKAFSWFMKAAEQDHPQAQRIVGGCYLLSVGTQRDPDKGIEYLVKSSDAGHLQASKDLADWYYEGIEDYQGQKLYKNPTLAHKYAMLAVQDETDGKAQYRLGTIIHHGFGNPAGAKEWYRRAIANGCIEAKPELAKALLHLQEELDSLWPLLKGSELSAEQLGKAGYAEILYLRSVCLENGYGCSKQKRQAKELYNQAIALGYVDTAKKKKRFGLF